MQGATLARIPDDCLKSVLLLLDGASLYRLWSTGDIAMKSRLTAPGIVTEFRLEYQNAPKLVWPRIIKEFRSLTRLDVSAFAFYPSSVVFEVDLSTISSQMRHIKLHFANALFSLVDWSLYLPLRPSTELPNQLELVDIAYRWPNLETLSTPTETEELVQINVNFEKLLPRLPKTLHLLNLHGDYIKTPQIADFSASVLKSLRIEAETFNVTFPPALESLTAYITVEKLDEHLQLPNSLTYLNISCIYACFERTETLFFLKELVNLTELSLHPLTNPTTELSSLFPSSLRKLWVHVRTDPDSWASFISGLPRALTHWSCTKVGKRRRRPQKFSYELDEDSVRALPRSLVVLPSGTYVHRSLWHLLPADIKTLLIPLSAYMIASEKPTINLPAGLKTLCIVEGDLPIGPEEELPSLPMPSYKCFALPPKLKYLTITRPFPSSWLKAVNHLRTLETLHVIVSHLGFRVKHINGLTGITPQVVSLRLPHTEVDKIDFGASWISCARSLTLDQATGSLGEKEYMQMPRDLQELRITGPDLQCELDFSKLPRNISRLTLSIDTQFDDHAVTTLPRSLKYLEIRGRSCDKLTHREGLLPLLSRGISNIYLPSSKHLSMPPSHTSLDQIPIYYPPTIIFGGQHGDWPVAWTYAYKQTYLRPGHLSELLAPVPAQNPANFHSSPRASPEEEASQGGQHANDYVLQYPSETPHLPAATPNRR